jgi:hypothetical protein
VRNNPRVIARPDGAQLQVPAGFNIEEYLTDFRVPRFMLLGPNKELLISDAAPNGQGCVWVVQGKERKKLIENLTRPYGLALERVSLRRRADVDQALQIRFESDDGRRGRTDHRVR